MKYCLALDLVDDEKMIETYEAHHKSVSPEIIDSIKKAGITNMEIYRVFDRMFMIMETDESFSFDKKDAMDKANPRVQEWENFVWKFQQALPQAKPGEKWVLMKQIFQL